MTTNYHLLTAPCLFDHSVKSLTQWCFTGTWSTNLDCPNKATKLSLRPSCYCGRFRAWRMMKKSWKESRPCDWSASLSRILVEHAGVVLYVGAGLILAVVETSRVYTRA